jgi:cystathionine beta-lyase/cystathionine gamma-synthase
MSLRKKNLGISPKCVHIGSRTDPAYGSLVTPIYQTTTFEIPSMADYIDINVHGTKTAHQYSSSSNPTQRAAELKIAALENGEDALVFSGGTAAITSTISAFVKKGDEIISHRDVYPVTFDFLKLLDDKYGIKTRFFDTQDVGSAEKLVNDNTKLIYIDTPTNPALRLVDIAHAVEIAQNNQLISIIDNTFASPLNQKPLDLGVDIVVESATKSLSGHQHVVCGAAVSTNEKIKLIKKNRSQYGQSLDPFGAFLLITGMQTMALRVERANSNALALARLLEGNPNIEKVYYPGLTSHPQHELAKKQMSGFGSMISFDVKGGSEGVVKLIDNLELVKLATSLGGVDTIVAAFGILAQSVSQERQDDLGVTPGLVRLSVGIEDLKDLENDISRALTFV